MRLYSWPCYYPVTKFYYFSMSTTYLEVIVRNLKVSISPSEKEYQETKNRLDAQWSLSEKDMEKEGFIAAVLTIAQIQKAFKIINSKSLVNTGGGNAIEFAFGLLKLILGMYNASGKSEETILIEEGTFMIDDLNRDDLLSRLETYFNDDLIPLFKINTLTADKDPAVFLLQEYINTFITEKIDSLFDMEEKNRLEDEVRLLKNQLEASQRLNGTLIMALLTAIFISYLLYTNQMGVQQPNDLERHPIPTPSFDEGSLKNPFVIEG